VTLASTLACTNMGEQEQRALTGADIGAAAGAAIADLSGARGCSGAAIGASAGGMIGNIKEKETQKSNLSRPMSWSAYPVRSKKIPANISMCWRSY